jgi:hypothetical protein
MNGEDAGRCAAAGARTRWAGPDLGAHNEEILCGELGLSAEELDALVESGAVGVGPGWQVSTRRFDQMRELV